MRSPGPIRSVVLVDGTRYGLATPCIGAGMGISTILEAVRQPAP